MVKKAGTKSRPGAGNCFVYVPEEIAAAAGSSGGAFVVVRWCRRSGGVFRTIRWWERRTATLMLLLLPLRLEAAKLWKLE